MREKYKVIQIFEGEFGCEERPDDEEPSVDVMIESEDGNREMIHQSDIYLYKMKINEGDMVCISDDGKLISAKPINNG